MKKFLASIFSLFAAIALANAQSMPIQNGQLTTALDANSQAINSAGTITASLFSGSGASLTSLVATNLASGTVPTARLGSGTASSSTALFGDQTYKTAVTSVTAPAAGITVSGTSALTLALADDLAAVEAISTTGFVKRTGTAAWSTVTAIDINSDTTGNLSTTRLSGTVPVANGGTAIASYTKGDLIVTPGSTTLNKLAVGTDGQVLTADAASTNGVKWATGGSGISGLTSGRVVLSTGSTTIGDDAAFLFSSASSVGTLTLGNSANGIVLGGLKLILKSASNSDIELTPQGTGNVKLTANKMLFPDGSQSAPSVCAANDSDTGLYFGLAGNGSVGLTANGTGVFYADGFAMFMQHTRFRPLSDNGCSVGEPDARFTYVYARHVTKNVRTVTASTTLDNTYQIVVVNSASGTTQTLPSGTTAFGANGNSQVYTIKNRGAGTITVAATAGTVEVTTILTGQTYTFISDGTNWYAIGYGTT